MHAWHNKRARILQRFFELSARFVELRAKADEALINGGPEGIGTAGTNANASEPLPFTREASAGANMGPSKSTSCTGGAGGSSDGRCVLVEQLDVAEKILSRDLEDLREDDLAVLVGRCERILETMLFDWLITVSDGRLLEQLSSLCTRLRE